MMQKTAADDMEAAFAVNAAANKIILHNVGKSYKIGKGNFTAIANVNITIQDNDFACIVGPSGCGKSTLLHMLAGLDFPTQGAIWINNKKVTSPGADRGMVFQTYTLFPWMTVEDNIQFGLKLKKMPIKQIEEITDKYLEDIKLTKFRKSYPKELSGGMKQRVAIARALANQPEVILMDEPFGALDQYTKNRMQLLLRELWQKEQSTIVFVTHDIDEAVFLATKIFVMDAHPGKVKEVVNIGIGENRTLEVKDTFEFIQLRKYINELLYDHQDDDEENI
ncbi:NitT/TauT family transport system ATP-binding protein [Propionispira arboris]|uniref:NitT/TauT family transport system ATP-binding protein n=1 Tax=Propionispira arboris TaxID=84035 RepID=A0A1H6V3W5_9FIRM|nr:ABC transporter ATP-binding protein [Propionispira arboris]SEI99221.1 NitT/TauT family transport system ATP-binding protein [Propionispira arboris]